MNKPIKQTHTGAVPPKLAGLLSNVLKYIEKTEKAK